MANNTLNTTIVLRNDTQPNWANTQVRLLKGEMAVEFQIVEGQISGSPKLKVGDGLQSYADLPYVGIDLTEIRQMIATAVKVVSDRLDTLVDGADEAFDTLKEIGDYINEHQDLYEALVQALANKVDKEPGKGLSTNDYTNADKDKLTGIETGAQRNTVTGVKGDAEQDYRIGNVNITKANIGLGNVDNTADADKVVSKANELRYPRKIDGVEFSGAADIVHYGESNTAANVGEKAVSITGFGLVSGAWVAVKFLNVNSAAPSTLKLNINNLGAKPIRYRGTILPSETQIKNNCVYMFVYDGTNYELIGDLDTEAASPFALKVQANGTVVVEYSGGQEKILNIASGITNGSISVAGTDVSVAGLKDLAFTSRSQLTKSDVGLSNVDNTADADKEVSTAETLKVARSIDGVDFDGSQNIVHYGVSQTVAAEPNKTVAINGFRLITGAVAYVTFAETNTASNPTLNINGTGQKNVSANGNLEAGKIYSFIYDGTSYSAIGSYSIATTTNVGLVKAGSGVDKISVAADGTMSLNSCSTDKLVQGLNVLVINGGSAS